jgi:hypothetical protein
MSESYDSNVEIRHGGTFKNLKGRELIPVGSPKWMAFFEYVKTKPELKETLERMKKALHDKNNS